MKEFNKKGFTLAEVLITLGIIGIVAALTLPTLMSNCRKYVIETQLKEFYAIMNQALKRAEYDYDDMDGWTWSHSTKVDITDEKQTVEYNTSDYEWFQKYLQPYLKTSTLKEAYHLYCVWYDGFAVEFINGTGMSCGTDEGGGNVEIGKFVCMFYPKAGTIKDIQDYSAKSQKVVSGKDYFVFQINTEGKDKGFQPVDSNNCKKSMGMRYLPSSGCAKLIKDNNWKFPKDYPIKI